MSAAPSPATGRWSIGGRSPHTLDEPIRRAEQRLMTRDAQWTERWRSLNHRVQQATRPSQLVFTLLGTLLPLLASGWLLRRLGRKVAPAHAAALPGVARQTLWASALAAAWQGLPHLLQAFFATERKRTPPPP